MSFLVRTPTITEKHAETLRIILRLHHAQLLQDEIRRVGTDPVILTEAIILINDIFEGYYYMVNAAKVRAKASADGRVQLILRESQWSEIWKLAYLKWSSDTPEGAQIIKDFEADIKSLQEVLDDPPLIKSDMLDAKPSPSGRGNTMMN